MAVAALEEATGRTLADLVRQFLSEPAGCQASHIVRSPDDLAALCGVAPGYHPGYALHGLAAGPLSEAARLLHELLAGALLGEGPRCEALAMHRLGDELPGRPWKTHGYGLGLMIGTDRTGRPFVGHTRGGPRSTIAVYLAIGAAHAAAAFSETEPEGMVEAAALREAAKDCCAAQAARRNDHVSIGSEMREAL